MANWIEPTFGFDQPRPIFLLTGFYNIVLRNLLQKHMQNPSECITCFFLFPDDFTGGPFNITVAANSESINIPAFFTVIDDDVDEDEQSFAIVAEIGPDVPDGVSCFQTALGETDCHGRRGATEIRITDDDRKSFPCQTTYNTYREVVLSPAIKHM